MQPLNAAQQALIGDLVGSYRPGYGLPRPFYTTPALYELELDTL